MKVTPQKIKNFKRKIWDFYTVNKRNFPWRNTNDSYHILISEIMLQQTQVSRVLHKYEEFLKIFPTLQHLAKSSNEELLKAWSGLGYNRRALYLKNAANYLFANPEISVENLVKIKGIGINTAGSIFVFTNKKPYPFIETNIRRVFIFEFFSNRKNVHDREILSLVENTIDLKNPKEWYYALMDYGAYLSKTEINPNRKSKHYLKQSKFNGSVRQTRGNILKQLLKTNNMSIQDLKEKINSVHFETALNELKGEGFLRINKQVVSI